MIKENYLWYPYLGYKEDCKLAGRKDSIQEWLLLTGKVDTIPDDYDPIPQGPAPKPEWDEPKVKCYIDDNEVNCKTWDSNNYMSKYW